MSNLLGPTEQLILCRRWFIIASWHSNVEADIGNAVTSTWNIASTANALSPTAVYNSTSNTGKFSFATNSGLTFSTGASASASSVICGTNVTPSSVIRKNAALQCLN